MMTTLIYVGNLSLLTGEEQVLHVFRQAGTVIRCSFIVDHNSTGYERFAFLQMASPAEADKAIAVLDGRVLDGQVLKVDYARPTEFRFHCGQEWSARHQHVLARTVPTIS
ncbi:MAG TPA: RNA-binding protein [Verrucomicrobiae bacterium]|nr:RNA-binding protein [Verrucomicrobiae bacterium]